MKRPVRSALALVAVAAGMTAATGTASADFQLQLSGKTLTVTGDEGSDSVTFRAKAGDPSVLQVDVDSDGSVELDTPRSQVDVISVSGQGGNDHVLFDTRNGPVNTGMTTQVLGGEGDDAIGGGDGPEQLFGGSGNDNIAGGPGTDHVNGGSLHDLVSWSPGDGTDTTIGGADSDVFIVNGSSSAQHVAVTPAGPQAVHVGLDAAPGPGDVTDFERVDVNLFSGDDSVTAGDDLPTGFSVLARGGPGRDNLEGGDGRDVFDGGSGDDAVNTGPGDDLVDWTAGEGDDQVDTGLGSDVVRAELTNGNDTAFVPRRADGSAVEATGLGAGEFRGAEKIVIDGFRGDDTVTLADGLIGAVVFAGDGDDTLKGGTGDDTLVGGPGADRISGGRGDDVVDGQADADALAGGLGVDTFRCGNPDTDTIADLTGEDVLDAQCSAPHARSDAPQTPAGGEAEAPGAQPAAPPAPPAPPVVSPPPPGPPSATKCVVPKLKKLTLAKAKKRLKAAHCKLGKVKKPRGRGRGRLVVAKQSAKPGTVRTANSKVAVRLVRRR